MFIAKVVLRGLKRFENSGSLLFRQGRSAITHGELHTAAGAVNLNVNLAALAGPMLRHRNASTMAWSQKVGVVIAKPKFSVG